MHQRYHLETWLQQVLISSNTAWKTKCFLRLWTLELIFRKHSIDYQVLVLHKQHQTSFSFFFAILLLQHRRMNSKLMLLAHHNTSLSHRLHKHTYPAFISLPSAKWKQKNALNFFSVFSLLPLLIFRREVFGPPKVRKSHNSTANQFLRKSLQLV